MKDENNIANAFCAWCDEKKEDAAFMTNAVNALYFIEQLVIAKSNIGAFWKVVIISILQKNKLKEKEVEHYLRCKRNEIGSETIHKTVVETDDCRDFTDKQDERGDSLRFLGFRA